jgi:hypothetical protein
MAVSLILGIVLVFGSLGAAELGDITFLQFALQELVGILAITRGIRKLVN